MDSEKQQGMFWLPGDPEEKADGAVTKDDDGGTTLTTYGRLGPSWPEAGEQRVIHGVLADSHIKLVNCLAINQRMNIGNLTATDETTWHCQLAFQGDDYSGDVPNKIKLLEAIVESLEEWTPGFKGIEFGENELSLSWPASEPDQSAEWNLGVVALHQDILPSRHFSRYSIESVTVRAQTSVRVSFDEPQSWETAMRTVLNLQALVSIAKGEAVNIERTSIVVREEHQTRS